jgi:hypothetical protein
MACATDFRSTASGLGQWYRDMTPCWMTAEPFRRRRLILRTHRWIAERVLEPLAHGEEPFVVDLEAQGVLAQSLVRTIPQPELETWQPWVRLALADLRQALASTPSPRSEQWVRWLFLIPYSIPVRGRTGRRTRPTWRGAPPKSDDLC